MTSERSFIPSQQPHKNKQILPIEAKMKSMDYLKIKRAEIEKHMFTIMRPNQPVTANMSKLMMTDKKQIS